jgi:hypothetical protein
MKRQKDKNLDAFLKKKLNKKQKRCMMKKKNDKELSVK